MILKNTHTHIYIERIERTAYPRMGPIDGPIDKRDQCGQ